MNRVCPNCNNNLSKIEHYFCLSCGHKLEDSLIVSGGEFVRKVHQFMVDESDRVSLIKKVLKKPKKKKVRKKRQKNEVKVQMPGLRKQLKISFIAVVLIGGLAVGVIYLTKNPPNISIEPKPVEAPQEIQETKPENLNVIDLGLDQPSIDLGNDNIIKYIPYETDFYIIGSDAIDSTNRYFGETAQDEVLSQVGEYVEGRFVIIGSKEGSSDWTLTSILYLKDKEVENLTFEDVTVEDWFIQKVDDVLVVTNTEEMIQNVTDSSKGLARNIAQNPRTRIDNVEVPDTGQMIFVNVNKEIDPASALMSIFPPTQEAEDLLKEVAEKNLNKFVIRSEDD